MLDLYFPVLDHGHVALVDYLGSDGSIERAARNSYLYSGRKGSDQRSLVRFLKRNRHSSPIEMCELVFHCAMPIFVARQWVRHRTASINEVSARYSMLPMVFYTPTQDQFSVQSKTNKQGREGTTLGQESYQATVDRWTSLRSDAQELYEDLLEVDVARELARIDLPLSTYTSWYWKIDLHNLFHFLGLRCDSHAQHELRMYGNILAGIAKAFSPLAFEAWIDYEFCGTRLSRMEMHAIRNMIQGGTSQPSVDDLSEMSQREITEFKMKLQDPPPIPDFKLALDTAKSALFFEEKYRSAIPVIDRGKGQ